MARSSGAEDRAPGAPSATGPASPLGRGPAGGQRPGGDQEHGLPARNRSRNGLPIRLGERRRLIRDVETAGLHRNGERWLSEASEQVLAVMSDGREATSSELRDVIPLLEGSIAYGEGKSWGGHMPVGPRVLTTLSAAGRIVRASNDGRWATSRPRWASMKSWLGRRSPLARKPTAWRDWSRSGYAYSAPVLRPTSSGGSGRPSGPCAGRWLPSTRSRSISTGEPGSCFMTT